MSGESAGERSVWRRRRRQEGMRERVKRREASVWRGCSFVERSKAEDFLATGKSLSRGVSLLRV
jgi:hypothetical protein